jgi:acyl-CoA hydrolase
MRDVLSLLRVLNGSISTCPSARDSLPKLVGRVTGTGRTSLTVEVELWAEDLLTGKRELCTKGSFVLVAVDDHGKPVAIS